MLVDASGHHQKKKGSGLARVAGSALAGVTELLVFHPVDTVAKRLMNNRTAGLPLTDVVFAGAARASVVRKYFSLFPGLGFGAGYKILQRVYKFGGQPFARELMANSVVGEWFRSTFGERSGKALTSAAAGSLIGIGEVALLPLDVLKIKAQTNPEALMGRSVVSLLTSDPASLYRGWQWTVVRNAPGSFALFGGNSLVKQHVFHLQDGQKATVFQDFAASVGGAVASITVAAPADVIKTRIQAAQFNEAVSGIAVLQNLLRQEGVAALFKGLTPKVIVVGPKLVFTMTVASQLIAKFEGMLHRTA